MPRKRASRSRTRTGSKFARKLTLEVLEDRRLLANVTVSNLSDVVNGNTGSIALLIARATYLYSLPEIV